MTGVFDRLQKQIEDKQEAGGISPLDLADLPPALRKIMRIMLRKVQMNYPELCEAMDQMPEPERIPRAERDRTLEALVQQAWLIQIGTGERAIYKVNLRRKAGSALAGGIWDSLDSKLKGKTES